MERIEFISPSDKHPQVSLVCGKHGKLRYDVLNFSDGEMQNRYNKNQVKYQVYKDEMQKIRYFRCRRCNNEFIPENSIWLIQYFRFTNEIQVVLKKSFRVHKECVIREMTLYGIGNKPRSDSSLDIF